MDRFGKRQRLVALYVATLALVCASVMVGPAVSGELLPGGFSTPSGGNVVNGSVASGNGTQNFGWIDASFSLINNSIMEFAIAVTCTGSVGPDTCDKEFGSNDPLAFVGSFTGSNWTPADTLTLSLTGEHTGLLNLDMTVTLTNLDGPGQQSFSTPNYAEGAGNATSILRTAGPSAVPFANFSALLELRFNNLTGSADLRNTSTAQFDTAVPEPASYILFAGGLTALALLRRKINSLE